MLKVIVVGAGVLGTATLSRLAEQELGELVLLDPDAEGAAVVVLCDGDAASVGTAATRAGARPRSAP